MRSNRMLSLAVIAMFLATPVALAAVPVAHAAMPTFHPGSLLYSTTSSNWAGYAVTGAKGSVTFVNGSWIVPTVTGCTAAVHSYSSFWVGIDGYSSTSVEQTGTDSDCNGATPTYYAWYEFYPKPSHLVSTLTIHAGDVVYAQVSFAGGKFTCVIKDVTTAKSFTTSATVKAQRTSAEWIAEAPSSTGGVLPLADFGTVWFGFDNTSVKATSSATVSSTTGLLGSFTTAVAINMVGVHSSTLTKATTSAISTDKTSFSVVWKASGP